MIFLSYLSLIFYHLHEWLIGSVLQRFPMDIIKGAFFALIHVREEIKVFILVNCK